MCSLRLATAVSEHCLGDRLLYLGALLLEERVLLKAGAQPVVEHPFDSRQVVVEVSTVLIHPDLMWEAGVFLPLLPFRQRMLDCGHPFAQISHFPRA